MMNELMAEVAAQTRAHARRERFSFPSLLLGGAHLAVLSAFALAQPLFDLFSKNAEFFAVRRSSPLEIVGFALAVTFLPPLAMLVVEALAGLASPILRRALHLVFVAGLTGLIAIQLVKRAGDHSSALVIGLAAAVGLAVALLYLRVPPARSFLTILSPSPLVFLALFLLTSPIEKLVLPEDVNAAVTDVSARTPVVMIVFDEFPDFSLMNRAKKIDADRFPNFARLARNATWFRNATTVSHTTTKAVPAIMTGIRPRPNKLPIFADHPDNIFTLLGGSYRMNVVESQTSLCPRQLCGDDRPRLTSTGQEPKEASLYSDASYVYLHLIAPPRLEERLPSVSTAWENFGNEGGTQTSISLSGDSRAPTGHPELWDDRGGAARTFFSSIRVTSEPTLNFAHILLPHGPYQYLPSGRQYVLGSLVALGRDGDSWGPQAHLVVQAYERYLYQLEYTDRLLGRLLYRLKAIGLYDKALIVVTADHGVSFRPEDRRRGPTRTNIQDVAYVPLFLKRPNQREPVMVDDHVETIDILPTIVDVLGISIPWVADGRSGFGGEHTSQVNVSGFVRPVASVLDARDKALLRQIRLFGTGATRPVLFGIGPAPSILGRSVSRLRVVGAGSASAEIDAKPLALLRSLPRGSRFYPSQVMGRVNGLGAGRPVAIAVNGRIAGTSTTIDSAGAIRFSILVPEELLHAGRNPVRVFAITRTATGIRLAQLFAG
ncbi:MAG TPA: sulfatase-like hydrolase/transferase [Gaiellaceae bacterium]|nr:sulfatase-like hydrolase/transferase [Gaiellaceae bacterium]